MDVKNLDWEDLIDHLKSFATSSHGRLILSELAPLKSQADAYKSFTEIEEATEIIRAGHRPHFESLDFYPHWHQRLQKSATLKIPELKDIRLFCHEALGLSEEIQNYKTPWYEKLKELLFDIERPLSAIESLISPAGEIRIDASENLYSLFREKEQQEANVKSHLDRLVKTHTMDPILQDRYVTTREGRWVLPVKSGMQHQIGGLIHDVSQSKQTVFMEPEVIVPINNRIRQLELEIQQEIEFLLRQISELLASMILEIENTSVAMEMADLRLAQAQLTLLLNAQGCEFVEDEISLSQLCHPLMVINREKVIPNGVSMDREKRILILSGPNAGGKTVLLKSIGLAAQMARCGLPIAADAGAKLPFFKKITVAVGDAQSVDAHLSTFAAHLKILNTATQVSGSDHLLLIDEICGSTDPEEGSALARSFIEQYAANQVFGIITSHLSPLKMNWDEDSGVINGSLEYDLQKGSPTYHFLIGVSGQSLAIQTAKKAGIHTNIIERANELLSPSHRSWLEGVDEIEKMKESLHLIKRDLEKERAALHSQKLHYEDMVEKFEAEKEDRVQKSIEEAQGKIEKMIQDSKVQQVFKRHEQLEQIKTQIPQMIKRRSSSNRPQTAQEFSEAFPPGSRVFVTKLNQEGVVQSQPTAKGLVTIFSQSMRLNVPWDSLQAPKTAPQKQSPKKVSFQLNLGENLQTIDLRGKTVEEAIEILEVQLDQACLHRCPRVKIIHGHGTEVLKKGVRTHLSRSVYVQKWQAAPNHDGGDGVTLVEMDLS